MSVTAAPDLVILLYVQGASLTFGLALMLQLAAAASNARRAAREARTRAALAESALADIRQRRSRAVAQGNRTRGQAQSELRAAKLAEMEEAIALRDAGGQRSLALESWPGASGTVSGDAA